MKLQTLSTIASLLSLSQLTQAARVIKVTKTVDNTVTNTNVVEGTMSTVKDWLTNTRTTTTTRYTSTYTLTIFGEPYTYVSVVTDNAPQPEQESSQLPEDPKAQEPTLQAQTLSSKPEETQETSQAAPQSTPNSPEPAPTPSTTSTKTEESELVQTVAANDHTLESGYVLESLLTTVDGDVCIVDYEYYDTTSTETVTSTSTITSTITV